VGVSANISDQRFAVNCVGLPNYRNLSSFRA